MLVFITFFRPENDIFEHRVEFFAEKLYLLASTRHFGRALHTKNNNFFQIDDLSKSITATLQAAMFDVRSF